jgi:hypothetical protein
MALNKCLIVVGLIMLWISATLEIWMALHPEQKVVGEGIVIDFFEVLSKREKWLHGGALLLLLVGTLLQVLALFAAR